MASEIGSHFLCFGEMEIVLQIYAEQTSKQISGNLRHQREIKKTAITQIPRDKFYRNSMQKLNLDLSV